MERVIRGLVEGEDGYELWLRYAQLAPGTQAEYRRVLSEVFVAGESATVVAIRREVKRAFSSFFGGKRAAISQAPSAPQCAGLVVGTPATCEWISGLGVDFQALGGEGHAIVRRTSTGGAVQIVVAAATDVGALYGTFSLLRHMARGLPLEDAPVVSVPRVKLRLLNHWDNLDGTIERGFAGASLWNWFELPDIVSPRVTDYARAMASVGLNGAALTNVNASALVLTRPYVEKVRALADVMRPYGVRVYLTARFNAPMELSGLQTADPVDDFVEAWWREKCSEIYELIPDFGGFVVKANSEGQPGPQDYGRTHAEGANLLARALSPHGGVVIWRAFVYSADVPADRATQAYSEFVPLDGAFDENVLVQVKNGPIDFQPREPHHPLFGAMRRTPVMVEFQLTQEYLGNSTHLCYLGPLFSELLQQSTFHGADSGAGGERDSRVSRVADGSLHGLALSGMSAVANIGDAQNWCGHPFASANWYAYGRLCWDPDLCAETLAHEWIEQTLGQERALLDVVLPLMMKSRQAVVDYMTPLGLHHIMAYNHHQGPAPWVNEGRADWTCTYYHRADEVGLGFDRTAKGSNALAQYSDPYREKMESWESCPLQLLLWYHHVPWGEVLSTGRTLWDELCVSYQRGVDTVVSMRDAWQGVAALVDPLRHEAVATRLGRQLEDSKFWKDACLAYFQTYSRRPYPEGVTPPEHKLAHYQEVEHYFVPGIPERRF